MIDIKLDMSRVNIDDVSQFLRNAGYIISDDFEYTREIDAFAYLGYFFNNDKHRYIVLMHNKEEDTYMVTTIFVWLGHNGNLVAEYAAMPMYESSDPVAAMSEYVQIRREKSS